MAVTWTQAGIALTLMAARTYTNGFLIKSFKWDYWWALITLVGFNDWLQSSPLTGADYQHGCADNDNCLDSIRSG